MALFRRKREENDELVRCANCRERLPEGATECSICGWVVRLGRTKAESTPAAGAPKR
jgi:rRNA maturation endonuclease Nob1